MAKLILIISLVLFTNLSSQNYFEQMLYLEGENDGERFGKYTAALDFNGDGYDDLAVAAPYYHDGVSENTGRICIYFGSETFDDQADLIVNGYYPSSSIGIHISNLGDMNNDGKEDLGFTQHPDNGFGVGAYILLGNTENNTSADFDYIFPTYEYTNWLYLNGLGDINNDGFDDAGISIDQDLQPFNQSEFYLIYGTDNEMNVELFGIFGEYFRAGIGGVGDVNNDGYDDFCLGYRVSNNPEINTNILYYGGEVIDTTNTVTLYEYEGLTNTNHGLAAGYLNGDEYADFVGDFGYHVHIWYGSENITDDYDLELNDSFGGSGGKGYDYGDLNNDGYDDMVFGMPGYAWDDGVAFLFLGGEDPNNTIDFEFEPDGLSQRYGSSVNIGNFNGDEYDDVAISGPESILQTHPGYVYVFSGNGDLEDYVSVDENIIPDNGSIEFKAYPNPFNPTVTFEVKAEDNHDLQIEIFNIKGQKVTTLPVTGSQLSWNVESYHSGIYLCRLIVPRTNQVLVSNKIVLLK